MLEYSEKYGMDVDEAVRLALDELGLTEDQVMVTVLEESSKGFLGLGSKLAKVRVERIPELDDEKDISQAEAISQEEKKKETAKATHDFRKKNRAQNNEQPSTKPAKKDGNKNKRNDGNRNQNHRDRDRDRDKEIEIDISGKESIAEPIENLVPDPDSDAAKFLTEVLEKMNLVVEVESFKNDECLFLEVKGQDSRMVIGKRGQTLDSLQYLTNLVSNKGLEEYKRVIIDVEGYRSRREKTLEQLAVKLAKKVLRTGRSTKLEPMNPYERKVIHATLQQVNGVSTRSEGEEPYRRVIIEKK